MTAPRASDGRPAPAGTLPSGAGALPGRVGAPRPARRGHTLTEVLMVLTVLVLFAGLALPRLASALLRSHLQVAMDRVRADIGFTRARAIASGLRHQLHFDPETREITVEPFRPELQDQPTAAAAPVQQPPPLRDRLPEQVDVVEWSVLPMSAGSGTGAQQATGSAAGPGTPLVCYPEGIGDSARVVLEDTDGKRRGLMLDGFTGEIRELEAEELPR